MYIFFGPGCLNFEFDSIFLVAKHPQEVKLSVCMQWCIIKMVIYCLGYVVTCNNKLSYQ